MAYGLLYDYLNGQCIEGHNYFGAHFTEEKGQTVVTFRLYAPLADDGSVIGECNNWDVTKDKMKKIDDSGVWEISIPGLTNYQCYKFHFNNCNGNMSIKSIPMLSILN